MKDIERINRIADGVLKRVGAIHVIPSKNKWAVKKHGAFRALRIIEDKGEAISFALKHSKYAYIHNKNGIEYLIKLT